MNTIFEGLGLFVLCLTCLIPSQIRGQGQEDFCPSTNNGNGNGEGGNDRKLFWQINPGCELIYGSNCSNWLNTTLLHISSKSHCDNIHFIWSFQGSPSLLLLRTLPETNVSFGWTPEGHVNSVVSTQVPQTLFSFSIHTLFIFDDPGDTARLDVVNQSSVSRFLMNDFSWRRIVPQPEPTVLPSSSPEDEVKGDEEELNFILRTQTYKEVDLGPGYLEFQIRVTNKESYPDVLPFLLRNSNTSQIDLTFHQLNLNGSTPITAKRFALGFLFAQPLNSSSDLKLTVDPTLDDEHTPGVFESSVIQSKSNNSYLKWRPIAYTGEVRDITDSVDVTSYGLKSGMVEVNETLAGLNNSILQGYDFNASLTTYRLQLLNISFGNQKDGFFNKTQHITWRFLVGYGTPPIEKASIIVILVLSVGLGVPALIILASGIFMVCKRISKPKDDLLLGR